KLSHRPFHWFVEFYGIISRGGFDVIIGNPPYVEYSKLDYSISPNTYKVNFKPDIYAAIIERSICIIKKQGKLSMIVPISIFSTKGFVSLQEFIIDNFNNIWTSNFADSCKLFQGITKRLNIIILSNHQKSAFYQTKYYKEKYNSDLFK
ncbi:MAG: Eco57I restriction-modification methylase domain-containing protein, partial [Dolichospermum sp.]